MKWVNATRLHVGQKLLGIQYGKKLFYSGGITVKEIQLPYYVIVKYSFGDTEKIRVKDAKFLVREIHKEIKPHLS